MFGHLEKTAKRFVNFKIYVVTTWLRNNCNPHIAKYLGYFENLDPDPVPGPRKTWTLKNLDSEKPGA